MNRKEVPCYDAQWWAMLDSNQRLSSYELEALTS